MKLAIVSTSMGVPWGGAEELWERTARAAVTAGHSVLVSVHDNPPRSPRLDALAKLGITVSIRPRQTIGRLDAKLAGLGLRFGAVRQFDPDIVLVSQAGSHDVAQVGCLHELIHTLAGLKSRGSAYVALVQWNANVYSMSEAIRARSRGYYQNASSVLCVSARNARELERQLAAPLPHARVVRNPVNLASTDEVPWPAPTGTLRLASIGRLDIVAKGQDVLLEALSAPAWRSRRWQLDIFGVGPHEAYLRALVEHYKLQDHVRFCGHTGDIRAVWAEHEALVVSSHSEGTPLVLVEAMLCARPAVVTDVGGNVEWVTHDPSHSRTGWIAPAPSPDSLAGALESMWADHEQGRLREIGARAREAALVRYEPDPGKAVLTVLEQHARGARTA